MRRVLLVDDDPVLIRHLARLIEDQGYATRTVQDALQAARSAAEFQPDIVLLDLLMPGRSGLDLLPELKALAPGAEVIIYTGAANVDRAVRAMKNGAFDFIQKPNNEAVLPSIERALELRRLREENTFLRRAYDAQLGPGAFLAFSEASRAVLRLAGRYRANPAVRVLIEGESGTGKELIARYIHYDGSSYTRPFVAINCGAIARELVESELFGYAPGAFTGALAQGALGKIEAASGGTLLLDEIGELEPRSQIKLLRFLEHGTFFPVGSHEERSVGLRIICATNRRLDQAVARGEFRRDLYYRINVGHIHIPPLRERPTEILPLAGHFLRQFSEQAGKRFDAIHPAAQRALANAPWEGNARELRNTIERIVLIEDGPVLLPQHLAFLRPDGPQAGPAAPLPGPAEAPLPEDGFDLEAAMLRLIERALEIHGHNQSRTARYLGITREALRYRMRKLDTQGRAPGD